MSPPSSTAAAASSSFGNLDLLAYWTEPKADRRWWTVFACSAAFHLVCFVAFLQLPGAGSAPEPTPAPRLRKVKLYLPPDLLTQKSPNRHQPTPSIDLASLLESSPAQARQSSPAPSARHFEMPKNLKVPTPTSKPGPQILAQAPNLNLQPNQSLPPGAMTGLTPAPPQAPNQPFQNIGSDEPKVPRQKVPVPNPTVQGAIQSLSQRANGAHMAVSDQNLSQPSAGSSGAIGQAAVPHTEVELQSDPQGADFRAYLARILAIVKANWRLVIPESARLGTLRGSTVIQFIINRDGSIPKLVTADESGSDALDRAAVAGISMSNPLPPLPADFKGEQVRLAFTFSVEATAR